MPEYVDIEFEKAKANMTEVRAIGLALEMANLSFIEEDAATEIKMLIKNLPSAEKINDLSGVPEGLKDVRETIGYIMSLIDVYDKRGKEYVTRHKATKHLPPRYDVASSRSLVKELVRISSVADDNGDSNVAKQSIKCAKAIRSEEIKEQDIFELVSLLKKAGYEKESNFVKEAGIWGEIKDVANYAGSKLFDGHRLRKTKRLLTNLVLSIKPERQYAEEVVRKARGIRNLQLE